MKGLRIIRGYRADPGPGFRILASRSPGVIILADEDRDQGRPVSQASSGG